MNIEIRTHYWPKTPELRELKVVVDGEVLFTKFLNQDEIWDLGRQLIELQTTVMNIGNDMNFDD